jgi:hypothetical protein
LLTTVSAGNEYVKADSVNIVSDNKQKRKDVVESPKWAVRLGYSPDLTSVGFKNLTKPGSAFSLLVNMEFQKDCICRRRGKKREKDYYAPGSEYKFKNYVTVDQHTLMALDGTYVLMYEIPLGIRYDFVQKAHSRLVCRHRIFVLLYSEREYKYYYKDYVHPKTILERKIRIDIIQSPECLSWL